MSLHDHQIPYSTIGTNNAYVNITKQHKKRRKNNDTLPQQTTIKTTVKKNNIQTPTKSHIGALNLIIYEPTCDVSMEWYNGQNGQFMVVLEFFFRTISWKFPKKNKFCSPTTLTKETFTTSFYPNIDISTLLTVLFHIVLYVHYCIPKEKKKDCVWESL